MTKDPLWNHCNESGRRVFPRSEVGDQQKIWDEDRPCKTLENSVQEIFASLRASLRSFRSGALRSWRIAESLRGWLDAQEDSANLTDYINGRWWTVFCIRKYQQPVTSLAVFRLTSAARASLSSWLRPFVWLLRLERRGRSWSTLQRPNNSCCRCMIWGLM